MKILDLGPGIKNWRSPSIRQPQASRTDRPMGAFTLVELLVVIAIIGALAALIVGLTAPAGVAKVTNRVKVERDQIVLAIGAYYKHYGFYPPDNTNDVAKPPLYYELTGVNLKGPMAPMLGIAGTANVDGKNFHPNLKPAGYARAPENDLQPYFLVVPYGAPPGGLNTWRYRSTKPEHNTESYDLWAEVTVAGKSFLIGNWQD